MTETERRLRGHARGRINKLIAGHPADTVALEILESELEWLRICVDELTQMIAARRQRRLFAEEPATS